MLLFCFQQTQTETETCYQTIDCPLRAIESLPSADMEMLLAGRVIQTLVPPVCSQQCRRDQPLACGPLPVCSSWLNTCSHDLPNVRTKQQRQNGCESNEKADSALLSSSDP